MKYKIRNMLATGAAITTLALTLGQTTWAQDNGNLNAATTTPNPAATATPALNALNKCGKLANNSKECRLLRDQLTFEQLQAKMLEKLTQAQSRLNAKLAKVDTLKVSDEVKAKMKDHINARLQDVNKRISLVKAASTKEELLKIRNQQSQGSARHLKAKMRGLKKGFIHGQK
jgi:hypothetical protein